MPDSPDPTRTGEPPADATRDAPPAEPGTVTARTHTHDRDPDTATVPPDGPRNSVGPLDVLPGFVVTRELGGGGMGIVYEARQTRLNRLVALKVLRGGHDAKDVIRFLTEAEAVAAVKHPHVVQVYEFGQHADRPYLALELLAGGTLSDQLNHGKLEPRAAAGLVAKLADAVQHAHDLGIVHRDLKPSNVLFDEKGTPKVTDFGLAKRAGGADLTHTRAVMGTPAYMAPEQARGDTKFVGPSADVWALGAILYECLTGKRAFDADDTWAILRKVTDEAPPRPRSHVPGLPRDLELIALKCLEKNPADRYPSAAALADDLKRFLAGRPVSVRPAGSVERFAKWVRRNPVVAGFTAALVFVGLVGFVGVTWALLKTEERERELARANGDLTASQKELADTNNALRAAADTLAVAKSLSDERGYLSDVALAHQLWKANDLAGMRAALDRCPPERRKWEWHYLKGLSRPERAEYITDAMPLAVAYSPDGKLLAYSTLHGTLAVIETATGRPRHTVPGDGGLSGRTESIAFRPDGGELAYIAKGRVRVVDLATGKWRELKDPRYTEPMPGALPSVAVGYTPEGKLLAAAEGMGKPPRLREFVIRDAVTAEPVSTFVGFEQPKDGWGDVTCAAFSPDGSRFAACAVDSGIGVRGANDPPSERVGFDPRVFVWDVRTGKLLRETVAGSSLFSGVAFDPDGRAVGFGRGAEPGAFEPVGGAARLYAPHNAAVNSVAFDRNGLVWSGGEDKMVRAHDRKTGAERFAVRGCSRTVLRVAVSPDGKEVAVAAGDIVGAGGAVYRFDVSALAADSWRADDVRDRISLVTALAPDASRFAALSFRPLDDRPESFRFVTRDLAGGGERAVAPAGHWLRGAFAPDGRLFVLEREKPLEKLERVRVIEPDGKPGPVVPVPAGDEAAQHTTVVACTPDGRTLAAVDAATGRAKLLARLHTWDAGTGRPRVSGEADLSDLPPPNVRFPGLHPLGVAADREGKRLAAVFAASWEAETQTRFELRGALVVWDLATGKQTFRKTTADPLRAAAFDPQGRVAVAGGSPAGGVVFGWDVGSGEQFLSLRGHTRPVLSLAFGPGGRLATGGADRVLKVWDAESRREVLTLDGFAREVTHVAFTKDPASLVAATGPDTLAALTMAVGTPTEWPPAEVRVFRGPR